MTAGRFRIRPNECLVALAILILSVSMGLVNPVFFSLDNLSDLLRGGIVIGILALGVMVALVRAELTSHSPPSPPSVSMRPLGSWWTWGTRETWFPPFCCPGFWD